jgi:hypothetical protein
MCSSLAWQPEDELRATLDAAAAAGVTVVSLPLVNEWTQDRAAGPPSRTPCWRGVTALHELFEAGVPVALASDNTRDQFYQYGDLDMLEARRLAAAVMLSLLDDKRERSNQCTKASRRQPLGLSAQVKSSMFHVRPLQLLSSVLWSLSSMSRAQVFTQGVRLGQLDRPIGAWPAAVTRVPAAAMHLDQGVMRVGAVADLVLFRARRYSELLSRPQPDRVHARACHVVAELVHTGLRRMLLPTDKLQILNNLPIAPRSELHSVRLRAPRAAAQVVIRGGKAIATVPPDYKLLDYNADTRTYLHRHARTASSCDVAAATLEATARADARSDGGDIEGGGQEGARELVRGLSMVLASESVSSPQAHSAPSCGEALDGANDTSAASVRLSVPFD